MKELFESILGTFLLLLLMVGGLTCVTASVDAMNADKAKTEYVTRIEDSNFSKVVLQQTFDSADEAGYDVKMTVYRDKEDGSREVVKNIEDKSGLGDVDGTYMVRLELTFDYSFPFMNALSKHTLLGYAK
ncbi:MAG: hypothetical protein Q4B30_00765 [Coriobacteriaceae bacterium]|nr:hypothetical protein [Coriobacteriaceae bacterium]